MLYIASAIEAGDTSGGWTHVTEVACGLRALGHELLVITGGKTPGQHNPLDCNVLLQTIHLPKQMALLALPKITVAFDRFKPDVVMERFYNFAGAGVWLAHKRRIPVLLEVNAPMTDPPGSPKSRLDSLLLGSMRRWAVRQAKWSTAIITPLATTVPPEVSRRKVRELPWGANTWRFDPQIRTAHAERLAQLRSEIGLEEGRPVATFLGSFRPWHGAGHFAEAARHLLSQGSDLAFLAIGGGPQFEPLKQQVEGWGLPSGRFVLAGSQPHERVPDLLALSDIGVAPFDLAAHAPLRTFGFYWSPLKVFEYMAMSLPLVTIDVPPLNAIVRHEQEGLLYTPGDLSKLVAALARLGSDKDLRDRLGANARERVVTHYSWQAHCAALDYILKQITHAC